MNKKELKKYGYLYGYDIVHYELAKKGYKTVSLRKGSIPGEGSQCYKIECLNPSNKVNIENIILHKDNSVTIKSNKAFARYWP